MENAAGEADGPDATGNLGAAAPATPAGRKDQGDEGQSVDDFHGADNAFDCLRRAGWSAGEAATAGEWIVCRPCRDALRQGAAAGWPSSCRSSSSMRMRSATRATDNPCRTHDSARER